MAVLRAGGYSGAMDVALRKSMSLQEFLDWEERQELRYEFDGFQPITMTGGTVEQGLIQANLIRRLGNRLLGKPCRVFGSHVKIAAAGSFASRVQVVGGRAKPGHDGKGCAVGVTRPMQETSPAFRCSRRADRCATDRRSRDR